MRCMTYDALAHGATGLFYFAFDSGWKMREHPETWAALKAVVREVNERRPLFQGERQWWPRHHQFVERKLRFNGVLGSSISSTCLRVRQGNDLVPAGDYILAVNNTEHQLHYSFALPASGAATLAVASETVAEPGAAATNRAPAVAVLGEGRSVQPEKNRLSDRFERYAVHIYGPLRPRP
jgi:hypothetical protein